MKSSRKNPGDFRPLIVGEVLFDYFPNGNRIPGGAPFNVAWNLQGLGANPVFVGAVGDDDDGRQIRNVMCGWEMETAGLQVSGKLPTGRVDVKFENGEPSYDILDNRAFDELKMPAIDLDLTRIPITYHGSLACRHLCSRETILQIRDSVEAPVFVDLNVRQPWFDTSWAELLLGNIRWLKLNRDELALISNHLTTNELNIAAAAHEIQKRPECCQVVFVTLGENGACAVGRDGDIQSFDAPDQIETFVDSVGAGDAFAAAAMIGIWLELDMQRILEFATGFAARVCQILGATTSDRDFYQRVSIPQPD